MNSSNDNGTKFQKDMNKAIIFSSGSFVIASILFFIIYLINPNIWFLIISMVMLFSAVSFYYVVKQAKKKYLSIESKRIKE